MQREVQDEIINELIKEQAGNAARPQDACCQFLRDHAWPTWARDIARLSPDEALKRLGSGWAGLEPGHAEAHLRQMDPGAGLSRAHRRHGDHEGEAFVIRGRDHGSGSAWIPVDRLVPGDLILLSEGDTAPADIRLLRVRELLVDESALTGDPRPVTKASEWSEEDAGADPVGIRDLCFGGSRILAGTATGVVVATGGRTLSALRHAS